MICPLCNKQLIPSLFPTWKICSTQHYMIVNDDNNNIVYINIALNDKYSLIYSHSIGEYFSFYKENKILTNLPLSLEINNKTLEKLLKLMVFT